MLGIQQEGEPSRPPLLPNRCIVSKARKPQNAFSNDAHRKSGAFSFGAALSPVESCSIRSSGSSQDACTLHKFRHQEKNYRIDQLCSTITSSKLEDVRYYYL